MEIQKHALKAETIVWIAEDEYLDKEILPRVNNMPRDVQIVLFDMLNNIARLSTEAGSRDEDVTALKRELVAYVCGWYKAFPSHWMNRVSILLKEEEPEYKLYQELKKKFGD